MPPEHTRRARDILGDDVAALMAFLVSDDARYITGVEHRVDAGFMLE